MIFSICVPYSLGFSWCHPQQRGWPRSNAMSSQTHYEKVFGSRVVDETILCQRFCSKKTRFSPKTEITFKVQVSHSCLTSYDFAPCAWCVHRVRLRPQVFFDSTQRFARHCEWICATWFYQRPPHVFVVQPTTASMFLAPLEITLAH